MRVTGGSGHGTEPGGGPRLSRRDLLKAGALATAAAAMAPAVAGAAGRRSAATGAKGAQILQGTGELRMVGDQVITNLDPRLSLGPDGVIIRRNAFHTLLQVDSATGEVTPLLADGMPTQDDDLTWTVKIKPGGTWHDGTPVIADDVKYTVDWMLDPANNSIFGSVVLDGVDSIEVVDDTTVRFHLKRVLGSFLERLAAIAPVPRGAGEAAGADGFKTAPVGLGPFMLADFAQDDHYTLVPYEAYALGDKPSIAKASLGRIIEGSSRLNALQAGQAELDLNADPELFAILGATGLTSTVTDNDAGYNAIMLNNGTKPFNDKRVRLAMAHAIDRDEIVQAVWGGNATPQVTSVPPWYFMTDSSITPPEHDPDKAKALLVEAGYPDGCEIELMQGVYSTGLTMAAVLQAQLEKAGFKVNIKTGDADGIYSYVFDKTWQAFSMRGNTSIVGLYPDVMTRWVLQQIFNNASEEELAPLVKAFQDADAIPASDTEARKKAYSDIQKMINDDQRIVFLVNRKGLTAAAPTVQGVTMAPDGVPYGLTAVKVG